MVDFSKISKRLIFLGNIFAEEMFQAAVIFGVFFKIMDWQGNPRLFQSDWKIACSRIGPGGLFEIWRWKWMRIPVRGRRFLPQQWGFCDPLLSLCWRRVNLRVFANGAEIARLNLQALRLRRKSGSCWGNVRRCGCSGCRLLCGKMPMPVDPLLIFQRMAAARFLVLSGL